MCCERSLLHLSSSGMWTNRILLKSIVGPISYRGAADIKSAICNVFLSSVLKCDAAYVGFRQQDSYSKGRHMVSRMIYGKGLHGLKCP